MSFRLLDETRGEPERGAPPPGLVVSGAPTFETWSSYDSADGKYSTGLWRATAGSWRIRYTEWEYCEMLEGVSIVTAADGQSWTLKAGDKFVLEPGFDGLWTVEQTTLKRYVIRWP
jgi:uncharacterized cupin superfamily protein